MRWVLGVGKLSLVHNAILILHVSPGLGNVPIILKAWSTILMCWGQWLAYIVCTHALWVKIHQNIPIYRKWILTTNNNLLYQWRAYNAHTQKAKTLEGFCVPQTLKLMVPNMLTLFMRTYNCRNYSGVINFNYLPLAVTLTRDKHNMLALLWA